MRKPPYFKEFEGLDKFLEGSGIEYKEKECSNFIIACRRRIGDNMECRECGSRKRLHKDPDGNEVNVCDPCIDEAFKEIYTKNYHHKWESGECVNCGMIWPTISQYGYCMGKI